ncbi:MAG: OmpA family protein [Pseudorhizobium sp.]
MKSRLFASVAAPLVSLPLMMQPAFAVPPKIGFPATSTSDVIRVQETLILPPGTVPEEAPAEEAPEEEAPAEEAPAEEAPAEEAPAEVAPEPAPEVIEEAPAEIQPEAPAAEPEPEAAPEPEVAPEPEAAPAEAPAEAAPEEAPAEEAPAAPEEAPAEKVPVPETAPEAEAPAATEEQPAEQTAPAAEETAPATATEEQPAEAPAPEGEAPAVAPETAPDATAPVDGTTAAPADGTTTQEGAVIQPGTAAPAVEPPIATTTEQVERAQQIADDPSAAEAGETAVLPVENGAAVLDSQKEAAPVETAPAGTTAAPTDGTAAAPAPAPAQTAAPLAAPTSDAEAQAPMQSRQRSEFQASTAETGERMDGRPEYRRTQGWDYRDGDRDRRDGDRRDRRRDRDDRDGEARIIISIGDRPVVYHDDSSRFNRDGGEVYYERLPRDRYREVVQRPGGVQIVTIRNSSGSVVQRSRIVDGEEYVLYYAPELYEDDDYVWRDPALDLPPMRLSVPLDQYIIDTSSDPDRDYYEFLDQPPVEQVERVYSLDEVRYSARIRDKARRIDLDTVTFATGSAEIPMNQASSLRKVAEAMNQILEDNPAETFLIEGHTDAVGSDESNLILSDERAESVAVVLTDAFGVPPENLATQGYGERFLKIRSEGPVQENRRVTIRRITPLVKPVAAN